MGHDREREQSNSRRRTRDPRDERHQQESERYDDSAASSAEYEPRRSSPSRRREHDREYDREHRREHGSEHGSEHRRENASGTRNRRESTSRRRDWDAPDSSAMRDIPGAGSGNGSGGALVPFGDMDLAFAPLTGTAPVVVPGDGVSMGNPFIRRRERPLSMRLAIIILTACILVTGLFAVTPLGSSAGGNITTFQELAGSVVLNQSTGYRWVVAGWGDTPEGWASKYNVHVGGIYELNSLEAGQELQVGKAYKIPLDPNYGADYRPPSLVTKTTGYCNGCTTFGNSPWNSLAGAPPPDAICGPAGNIGNPLSYQLKSPNHGANWVRGFSWFHNGVDVAAPAGNPINPVQAGQVLWAGWDYGGFGWSVKINHCNGLSSIYGHMEKLNVVAGQNVSPNDIIGWEGSTGWSTGAHLHLSILYNNNTIDPMPFYGYSIRALTDNPMYS